MATLYENLQGGTTTDAPLTSGATTVNSAAFANLVAVASPDVLYLTLDPEGANGAPEIVKVTNHDPGATSVTVARAQQDTAARAHPVSSVWVHALTEADIDEFLKSVATANIADSAVTTVKIAADAVTGAKIADDSIDSEHLVDGSIDTAHIADAQVTAAKMAVNSVGTDQYQDASIESAHFSATAKPPAVAWGVVTGGYEEKVADQGTITSVTDVTDLEVTWTADVSRRYRTTVQLVMSASTTTAEMVALITDGSNAQKAAAGALSAVVDTGRFVHVPLVESGLSGSVTRKVRALRFGGTGTITVRASAGAPCFILVEDIGPA